MSALPILEGQFTEDEAQEVADVAGDAVADALEAGKNGLELRWAAEAAVKAAFGYGDE